MIDRGGERFVNQVHVDDAASALFHLARLETLSPIYNVCDSEPMRLMEVYHAAADALRLSPPPCTDETPIRKRGDSNKRVSNERIRATGWSPKFRSYQEWLAREPFALDPDAQPRGGGVLGVDPA
jgi:nucleoside-diphosphate-sugar epimerase